jgi:hypothetical protein
VKALRFKTIVPTRNVNLTEHFESMDDLDVYIDQIGEEVSAEIAAERKSG